MEFLHDLAGCFFDLLGGQCLLGGADGQADGHGFLSGRDLLSSVLVNEGDLLEEGTGLLLAVDGCGDLVPGDVVVEEHGDVVIGLRILCGVFKAVGPGCEGLQLCHVELEEHDLEVLDAAFQGSLLCKEAEIADLLFAKVNVHPDNVVSPDRLLGLAEGEAFHVGVAGHELENALCLAEEFVHGAGARKSGRDVALLLGKLFGGIIRGRIIPVEEYLCLFEDGEFGKIALVLYHCFAEVGKEGASDVGKVRCRRHGKLQDAFGASEDGVDIYVVHPGIGVDFLHMAADRKVFLDPAEKILVQLVNGAFEGGRDRCCFEVVVAVHTGDFFHDVILDGDVAGGTPCRRGHVHGGAVDGNVKTEDFQLLCDVFVGEMFSQTLFQPVKVDIDLGSLEFVGIAVAPPRDGKLRIELLKIMECHGNSLVAALGIDGLLIAGGSFRTVVIAKRCPADAGGLEVRDFQDDALCFVKDGILGTAHDAGQGDRAFGIGDDKVIVCKRQILIVQKKELLSFLCPADNDVAGNIVGVKRMGRVARCQHDVVGNVDQGVDRAHANLPDPALHLIGRRLYADAGHLHADVAGAPLRIVDLHMEVGIDIHLDLLNGL